MLKIDLQQIQTDYEKNLCNKVFRYELQGNRIVEIIFYREHFCHLIGLQYIYGRNKNYLGKNGYDKINNGEITIDSLIAHNKLQYGYIKSRIEHFNEIAELMDNGQFIRFYQDRTNPKTQIEAEYLIVRGNKTYTLHLFLRKETLSDSSNQYAPISFIVKSEKDKAKRQYTDRQEFKTILNKKVININY